jgi:hypothetical protein
MYADETAILNTGQYINELQNITSDNIVVAEQYFEPETKIADSVAASVNGAPDITKEIVKRSEIKCQCCEGLKLELNNITTDLETAMEIIGILKEELGIADTEVSDNTSTAQNNENGSYIPPSERNWIQIQAN